MSYTTIIQNTARASVGVLAAAMFVGLAAPASAATSAGTDVRAAAFSTTTAAAKPCQPGFVWRDSFEGDAVCVTPQERDAVHNANPNRQPGGGASGPATCKSGFVWRDSFEGDALCVTPQERDAVHQLNPNRQPGGGAYGPATCKSGYVWRDSFDGDAVCVTPQQRDEAQAAAGR
jgi:hypothetical protein